MLATILKSSKAEDPIIAIVEAYAKLKELLYFCRIILIAKNSSYDSAIRTIPVPVLHYV